MMISVHRGFGYPFSSFFSPINHWSIPVNSEKISTKFSRSMEYRRILTYKVSNGDQIYPKRLSKRRRYCCHWRNVTSMLFFYISTQHLSHDLNIVYESSSGPTGSSIGDMNSIVPLRILTHWLRLCLKNRVDLLTLVIPVSIFCEANCLFWTVSLNELMN